jgi:hypothetical protein
MQLHEIIKILALSKSSMALKSLSFIKKGLGSSFH